MRWREFILLLAAAVPLSGPGPMHLIAHLIHEYGLIAVATTVALECVGFPVPGETTLLGAAIDAGTKHDLNIGASSSSRPALQLSAA
jgi:hypothetical protein